MNSSAGELVQKAWASILVPWKVKLLRSSVRLAVPEWAAAYSVTEKSLPPNLKANRALALKPFQPKFRPKEPVRSGWTEPRNMSDLETGRPSLISTLPLASRE